MDTHEDREAGAASSIARSVSQLVDLADLASAGGELRAAVAYYDEALARLNGDDDATRPRVLRKLSDCLLRLGETVDAQTKIQQAAFAARSASVPIDERARIELQTGRVRARLGHLDDALQHAGRAAALHAQTTQNPELAGEVLLLQGSVAHRMGQIDAAMRHYQDALLEFKKASDLPHMAQIYRNIGMLHGRNCSWSRALECYQVAHNLMTIEGSVQDMPGVVQSLGIMHLRMGHLADALEHFKKSERLALEISDPIRASLAKIGQAEVHEHREELDAARDLYREVVDTCLLRTYNFGAALAYVGLGGIALTRGHVPEARAACERARETVERGGVRLEDAAAQAGLDVRLLDARVMFRESRFEECLAEARSVEDGGHQRNDRLLEARCLRLQAEVLHAQHKMDAANDCLSRGSALLEKVGERHELAAFRALQGGYAIGSTEDLVRLQGLQHLLEAGDLYHALDLAAQEARVVLKLAAEDIRQRALDRASDRLARARTLRQRLHGAADIDAEVQRINGLLESSYVNTAVSTAQSLDAQNKMQRLLRSPQSLEEKLGEFLALLASNVPSNAACVLTISGADMRVVGAYGIPELRANRVLRRPPAWRSSSWPEDSKPLVFLNVIEERGADLAPFTAGRNVASALVVPLGKVKDGFSVLYVDRLAGTSNPQFHQAEVTACTTLARQLAGFLEEAGLRDRRGLRELQNIERNIALADIVTQNKDMQAILGVVSRIAGSNLTALLQGETGTGKRLIARAIHQCSARAGRPFVTIDCASLAETILESELFGHVKGAFTGALQDRIGLIEQANGGTVFLDEIDKTNPAVQRHFLHLLDCGEIRPIGSHAYRSLDIRVVCATSASDLGAEVEQGRFIKDLYFRLNDITISVPPLRRRKEDIPLLAEYFHDLCAQNHGRTNGGISQIAMQRLTAYDWPGNVRELEKVISAAVVMADDGETIGLDLLPSRITEHDVDEPVEPDVAGGRLKDTLESMERQAIVRALDEVGWNKSRAAVLLGLSRKGLKNKIARYGLDRRAG